MDLEQSSEAAAIRPRLKIDRIGRNLLFTTAFVETVLADGRGTAGTCFFYNALAVGDELQLTLPVLVTNKHVVAGAVHGTIRMLRADDDEPLLGQAVRVDFTERDWVAHPDPSVDVAATVIGGALSQLRERGTPVFYRVLARDLLPTDEDIEDLDVVEPVTFVGYPNALFDSVNLTPIVRRGTTATPIQLDYCGLPQFLVDASIFPGSSGSPVFLIQEHGYRQGNTYMMGQSRIRFLGLISAVHQQASSGRIVTSTAPTIQFDQMIDLGIVFKWNAVEATVDELCRIRGIDRTAVSGPPTDA